MIGLLISIVVFNLIAFKTNNRLTSNQTFHIWTFTIAFQVIFDIFIEFKYHGYWYFDKSIEWIGILPHTLIVPPVNMMFLNWYPFNNKIINQTTYIILFTVAIVIYEAFTLLPEPWGYFHNGWWKLWYSAIIDPILLLILLGYYKLINKAEKNLIV